MPHSFRLSLVIALIIGMRIPVRAQSTGLSAPVKRAPANELASDPTKNAKTPPAKTTCSANQSHAIDACTDVKKEGVLGDIGVLVFEFMELKGKAPSGALVTNCQKAEATLISARDANRRGAKSCLKAIEQCMDTCKSEAKDLESKGANSAQSALQAQYEHVTKTMEICGTLVNSADQLSRQADEYHSHLAQITQCIISSSMAANSARTGHTPVAAAKGVVSDLTGSQATVQTGLNAGSGSYAQAPSATTAANTTVNGDRAAPTKPGEASASALGGASVAVPGRTKLGVSTLGNHATGDRVLGVTPLPAHANGSALTPTLPTYVGGAQPSKTNSRFKILKKKSAAGGFDEGGGGGGSSGMAFSEFLKGLPSVGGLKSARHPSSDDQMIPSPPLIVPACSDRPEQPPRALCSDLVNDVCAGIESSPSQQIDQVAFAEKLKAQRQEFMTEKWPYLKPLLEGLQAELEQSRRQKGLSPLAQELEAYFPLLIAKAQTFSHHGQLRSLSEMHQYIYKAWLAHSSQRWLHADPQGYQHLAVFFEHALEAVRNSIRRSEVPLREKARLFKIVSAVQLHDPTKSREADGLYAVVCGGEMMGLNGGLYDPGTNLIYVCPVSLEGADFGAEKLFTLLTHELGHAIDSYRLATLSQPIDLYAHYFRCLEETQPNLIKTQVTQAEHEQMDVDRRKEVSADFWVSRSIASMEWPVVVGPNHGKAEPSLRQAWQSVCLDSGVQGVPAGVDRINAFGQDLQVRTKLNCQNSCLPANRSCSLTALVGGRR